MEFSAREELILLALVAGVTALTALAVAGAPRFLLSEALRGEGAWLVNHDGDRFVQRVRQKY
jgi:succinate dehydrogenase/fumarate reductase flavoprotein subunit